MTKAKKKVLTVRMPNDLYELIGRKSATIGVSINSLLLTLLNLGIKTYEKTN